MEKIVKAIAEKTEQLHEVSSIVLEQLQLAFGQRIKGTVRHMDLQGFESEDIINGVAVGLAARCAFESCGKAHWVLMDALISAIRDLTSGEPDQASAELPFGMISAVRSGHYRDSDKHPNPENMLTHLRDICVELHHAAGESTPSDTVSCAWMLAELATWCPTESNQMMADCFEMELALTSVKLAAELEPSKARELERALYAFAQRQLAEAPLAAE